MASDFLASLGEFSVHVGVSLLGKGPEPVREVDPTTLANAIVNSAVEQASELVTKLGLVHQLDYQRGEFALIVGVIARELFSLAELFTGRTLSLRDCSLDVGTTCMRAIVALRR